MKLNTCGMFDEPLKIVNIAMHVSFQRTESIQRGPKSFISNYSCLDGFSFTGMSERYVEGYLRFTPQKPKHSALTLLRSGLWAAPVRLGIPAWQRRRALAPILAALKPPGPCWYLNGIGVEPSAQRTGLGSALINQMLPRIDDDALPAFLDTSAPDNLGYYERFGFNVTAESTLLNGVPLWGMTRQPNLALEA